MAFCDEIKSLALEAGFHAVGITRAEPFLDGKRILGERHSADLLESPGHHPKSLRVRTDLRECFPNARSIISVALSYLTDIPPHPDPLPIQGEGMMGQMSGSVARFARGLDYHHALKKRLSRLAESIGAKVGVDVEIRCLADTPLLMDRAVAVRAGIGSYGKNSCVYAGEYGSWVVLGELVTDIELEPDEPAFTDICGDCEKCVIACPTGAIHRPYLVDSRICLSGLTQSRGFIPRELREKLGPRIYGCDDCQSVCPLNRTALPGNVCELRSSEGLGQNPELIPLLEMSEEDFARIVGRTTAGWIGRTRFRRNVLVALGNAGDPAAVPGLIAALSDAEPVIRGHAAWALGRIGTKPARKAIEKAISSETDDGALEEMRWALDTL